MGVSAQSDQTPKDANKLHALTPDNLEDVLDYMDKHMATTKFRNAKQTFLPKANFNAVTTEDVIRLLVSRDKELHLSQQAQDEFVKRVVREGRKMFATCIFSEMSLTCVQALFEDGLSDDKFPFEESDCPGLVHKRTFRNSFLVHQSRFNTVYFDLNSEHEWDDLITKPIDFDESLLLGEGAFGHVYEIHIHGGQRSFSSVGHPISIKGR